MTDQLDRLNAVQASRHAIERALGAGGTSGAPPLIHRLAVLVLLTAVPGAWASAQEPGGEVRISIVYTGKSLGALGVLRAQDEHELVTEQANTEGLPFRLVSHPCWRVPGISVFLPMDEPEGDELPGLLAARRTAQRRDSVAAPSDTESNLAMRYNMIHELLIPLVDELALSVAADFFFFQGKVEATRQPGASLLLRIGLTYDRLWKPRFQPLF